MTKEIILATVFVITTICVAIMISEPTITFKPFSLSLRAWYKGAVWLIFMTLWTLITIGYKLEWHKGYEDGFIDGVDKTVEHIITIQNEKEHGTEQPQ